LQGREIDRYDPAATDMDAKPKTERPAEDSPIASLEFEQPILELERKIAELEHLSISTGMDLNGEIKPLKERCAHLIRETFARLTPWQQVGVARHPARPLVSDYVQLLFSELIELHGDRAYGDDPAILCALASMDDQRLLFIGHQKGKSTREKIACNFGCAHPEGYRKALLKMQLAEKFGLPVFTMINTPGAYPGIGAEERGQASAIGKNILEMSRLQTPILSVVIGECGSGGALGIGVADRILILEHAYYSVISPEGCAAILWKNGEMAPVAAERLRLTAKDLLDLGVADEIIPEPLGGAHRDHRKMALALKEHLHRHLKELRALPPAELLERRYAKYRAVGRWM
jgi:acetyl-CoA carboxylase carboxyl transferase subunit alpha